jgi:hypothetical protein
MRRLNNVWTDAEVERLKTLIASRASANRAAVALKRSKISVQNKARLIGTSFPSMRDEKRKRNAIGGLNPPS